MAKKMERSNFLDIDPQDLSNFIDRNLQPDQKFFSECCKNMDFLIDYLQNKSGFAVAETIKGGSLGNGTALKGRSDLDVVLYLSGEFKSMQDFTKNIHAVIGRLEKAIRAWSQQRRGRGRVEIEGATSHAVKIRVRYRRESGSDYIDVDLLPAYNIMKEGKTTAYAKMEGLSSQERQMFAGSLVPLQLEFVTKQPPNVKNMIRLVKYWRKSMLEERSQGELLPTSYVFELLTIYAWEQAGRPATFNTAKGLLAVLKILKDFQHINASWDINYHRDQYRDRLPKRPFQPFILDPANPFNNVCARFSGWPEVSKVAHQTLQSTLFKGIHITRKGKNTHGYNWV